MSTSASKRSYSISKSIVSKRRAADSAVARQGEGNNDTIDLEMELVLLYWFTRITLAIIWIWTAFVSWFVYPQAESINWLLKLGLFYETRLFFAAACLLDLGLGFATIFYPSHRLWLCQLILVTFYSLVIAFGLPEFIWHPFGPLIKNLAVFVCLGYLFILEPHYRK